MFELTLSCGLTMEITYDNEKDMKSFLSIIEIAIKKWWKIDLKK